MPLASVTEALAQAPLEACVKTLFALSWNEARRAIASGKISASGQVITDSRHVPGVGCALLFTENAPRPRPAIDLAVVYEDAAVIVVDKPSGLLSVPFAGAEEDSLDARVRAYLTANSRKKNVRPELGVVHRIDKETSGLLVFTRTWAAKQSLSRQFREHSVHRLYHALVQGAPKNATITTQIGRDRGDGLRGAVDRGGERAVTHVEVLRIFSATALVACRLETGRTHQIRIHLSERGHPVLGDHVYGKRGISASRLMLHAKELGFIHPSTGKDKRFDAPLPLDMVSTLRSLE